MIERAALLGLLLSLPGVAAPIAPASHSLETGTEFDARAFLRSGAFTVMAESSQRNDTDGRELREATLGSYFRVSEPLTTGLFYRRANGIRHNDDWGNPGTGWNWANAGGRGEDLLIADVTPKLLLDFLPGESWVGELKARFFHNFSDGENTLSLRPGLTYFWLRNEEPFLNFFLQYEIDFPLHYGEAAVNGTWAYFGTAYRAAKQIQLVAFTTLHTETWTTSTSFLAASGRHYTVADRSLLFGLGAIFLF